MSNETLYTQAQWDANQADWNHNRDGIISLLEAERRTTRRLNDERARWQAERTALLLARSEANLGPATTAELLEELRARIETDYPMAAAAWATPRPAVARP